MKKIIILGIMMLFTLQVFANPNGFVASLNHILPLTTWFDVLCMLTGAIASGILIYKGTKYENQFKLKRMIVPLLVCLISYGYFMVRIVVSDISLKRVMGTVALGIIFCMLGKQAGKKQRIPTRPY